MGRSKIELVAGTQSSIVVNECQVCGSSQLTPVLFVGYLPPVNTMPLIGTRPCEERAYPAEMLACESCGLYQLGLTVDPEILFPPSYPYTSGTTKILRDNFAQLSDEVDERYSLSKSDLVVDIGSNDGTLLSNFTYARVFGVEPTNAGLLAREKGIETHIAFFGRDAAKHVVSHAGRAALVTATNVFAHIEDVHEIVESILEILTPEGIFVSESHYLVSLIETLQYDTIYHEHLRYYSLTSLKYLLEEHGLEVIFARQIPTHGGSIRVYAARKGVYPVQLEVKEMLDMEVSALSPERREVFKRAVIQSKLDLYSLLAEAKRSGARIYGLGAPSRSSTLINYVGLDEGIIDCVLEISGSYKIGKYVPGTVIPVIDENILLSEPPEFILMFSWHLADELIPKIRAKGYTGKFIIPLPSPRIVE